MKKQNYHEAELGKVPDSVKNIEFKGTVIDASDCKEKKIADILSWIDENIEKEEKYKEKLVRLKNGLMQKLLSWEVRVRV